MVERRTTGTTRRRFLGRAAAMASLGPIAAGAASAAPLATLGNVSAPRTGSRELTPHAPAPGYATLRADEAAFAEALVRALCPSDRLTPDGVACGLAREIDRELSGALADAHASFAPIHWEHSAGESQDTSADRHFFAAGVAAINAVSRDQRGVEFAELAPASALTLLADIESSQVAHARFPLAAWLTHFVQPLVVGAALAEPIHREHSNRVFWKVIGSAT